MKNLESQKKHLNDKTRCLEVKNVLYRQGCTIIFFKMTTEKMF